MRNAPLRAQDVLDDADGATCGRVPSTCRLLKALEVRASARIAVRDVVDERRRGAQALHRGAEVGHRREHVRHRTPTR